MSASPTGFSPLVGRFGPTERALHWVHAIAFFALLGTGLALYLPVVASVVGDRPLVKAVHLASASLWLTALAALAVGGDLRQLLRTRRELERFTEEDLRWLRRAPARSGRFNAGQKVHSMLQTALSTLFVISGVLLWLGERDTALRLPGTIPVHDACTLLASVLVAGHLYLALGNEPTAPALQGMFTGAVPAEFAAEHHPAWTPAPRSSWRPSAKGRLAAAVVVIAGLVGTAVLVDDVLGGADGTPPAASGSR